jgi:hypothetical protein
MRVGALTKLPESPGSIEVLRDCSLRCVSVPVSLEWIRNPMLYPFELRALSDKPSAPSWNSVEASTRRNAFRPLHCDFTARRAAHWPGRLCGWILRLR